MAMLQLDIFFPRTPMEQSVKELNT